ncbi:unnamed protein product [Cylindrotheca closterium]|uniref:Helicase-associated domain-containing protein n=1 Tax=Cylindrotheca closterium TaxID=2856 RepID=A0AAD2CU58_9STRA|nr:unnamed protein product [Cylindrotheca closterium]
MFQQTDTAIGSSTPVACGSSPMIPSKDKHYSSETATDDSLLHLLSVPLIVVDPDRVVSSSATSQTAQAPPPFSNWDDVVDLFYYTNNTIPEISVSSSNDSIIEASSSHVVGPSEQELLLHVDFEPTPIHPRLTNVHNSTKSTLPFPPLNGVATPLFDFLALDRRFIAQELNEAGGVSPNVPDQVISRQVFIGSKRSLLTPTEELLPITIRPAKRSRIRQVSNNDTNDDETARRVPHFRNHQEKQWKDLFDQLLEFKKEKGHCLVPHTFDENPPLARWVKRQRYQYKLKQEKMVSTLTDDRISQLESVGFVWDSHAVAWEEHRLDLVQFKAAFGHCNVPSAYEKNPSLSTWVKRQRRQKKLFWSGSKSTMTMERFSALNKLGFSWEIKTKKNKIQGARQQHIHSMAVLPTS